MALGRVMPARRAIAARARGGESKEHGGVVSLCQEVVRNAL